MSEHTFGLMEEKILAGCSSARLRRFFKTENVIIEDPFK
jgi:hypothetical protein